MFMRKKHLYQTVVAALLTPALAIGLARPALADTTDYICDIGNPTACASPTQDHTASGTPIRTYPLGNNYLRQLRVEDVGTVSSTWPFFQGSGNNTRFKGDRVVRVHYRADYAMCIGNAPTSNGFGNAVLHRCSSTDYYVKCGQSSPNQTGCRNLSNNAFNLISVNETDHVWENRHVAKKPYALIANCIGNCLVRNSFDTVTAQTAQWFYL
jgi:hypothetical protein